MVMSLLPEPVQSYEDSNGRPLNGGKLYTYAAGTTTPKATYQDQAGTIPNTNPIILNERGEATVWGTGTYRFVLKNAFDATIWDRDNIQAPGSALDDAIAALRADLVNTSDVGKGDALVGVKQPVAGSVARTQHTKNTEIISVLDFGAVGDGVADDTAAFIAAVTSMAGKAIFVPDPPVKYILSSLVTLPANTCLYGESKFSTRIDKSGNNDMFSLGDGAELRELYLEGRGDINTAGRGIVIGVDGHQNVINCRIINFPDFCVEYTDTNGGSQSIFENCEISRYNAPRGSGKYSINMPFALAAGATPRSFISMQSNGTPTFNFGGCNNVYIRGGYLSDMNFSINSRAVLIIGARIGMDNPLQISGAEIVIVGCDVGPQVVLTPGVQGVVIGPNSYNNLPVVDNSANGRNLIYHWDVSYTPTLGNDGGGAFVGTGVINGRWSRQGSLVNVVIEFTIGGTTSLGASGSALYFTLPTQAPNANDLTQACGTLYLTRNGTVYTAVCFVPLPSSGQRVYMIRDTSGYITPVTPGAGSSIGDQYRLEFTYSVGA